MNPNVFVQIRSSRTFLAIAPSGISVTLPKKNLPTCRSMGKSPCRRNSNANSEYSSPSRDPQSSVYSLSPT
jgi:hypothetical protein